MPDRTIALRAIADAERNVGVHEVGGNNHGPAVEIYQHSVGIPPGQPWCAALVWYRLATAALWTDRTLPSWIPRSGYTPTWANAARANGHWLPVATARGGSKRPRRGDLVCFYFASLGRIAHIGIVAEVRADGVVTVEGNTSPDGGVDRDGGGIYRKMRTWSELGKYGGFILLDC
jgi:hypothetical protein